MTLNIMALRIAVQPARCVPSSYHEEPPAQKGCLHKAMLAGDTVIGTWIFTPTSYWHSNHGRYTGVHTLPIVGCSLDALVSKRPESVSSLASSTCGTPPVMRDAIC